MTGLEVAILVSLICLMAALYASIGHGGASGYLAVMALLGVTAIVMRPSALMLNVLVATLATVAFVRAGHFRWSLLWPFLITSIPCAFLAGGYSINEPLFKRLVAATLLIAALRMFMPAREVVIRPLSIPIAAISGALIGGLSGLVGVGGGILLTPLMVICRWATPREAAAVSAPFILLNSLAGIAGLLSIGFTVEPWLWLAAIAALVGGTVGARWSIQSASQLWLRRALGVVLLIAAIKFVITS
ncbi:MAG: sulfite exporter TauE/SafE family protein [Phycisphaerales bacterium]|nr:sulfite exporter TauE/SafE family protein [Phycisphaerales bacterium]